MQWVRLAGCAAVVLALAAVLFVLLAGEPPPRGDDETYTPGADADSAIGPVFVGELAKLCPFSWEESGVRPEVQDKWLEVYGVVCRTGTEAMGHPYVILGEDENGGPVQCIFSPKDKDTVAGLAKGEKVVITGKCTGRSSLIFVEECMLARKGWVLPAFRKASAERTDDAKGQKPTQRRDAR